MEINRQELIKALNKVRPGVANKEIMEFTNCFSFHENIIRAYNDQISVLQPMKTGLKGAVLAQEFFALINKLSDETLDIENDEDKFIIKGKRSKAKINIVQEYDLPSPIINNNSTWNLLPGNFIEGISFCLFSTGKDMTRPELTNLNIAKNKIFSTDKYRITRWIMDKPTKKNLLLPGGAATHLIRYAPTKYFAEKEWIHFINDEKTIFSSRIMSVEYPDIEPFLAVEGDSIKFPPDLISAIDRAEILAKTEFEQDLIISLSLKKSTLICKGEGVLGEIQETFRIKYNGPDIELFIHPIFLKEILSKLKEVIIGEHSLLFEGDNFSHVISLAAAK